MHVCTTNFFFPLELVPPPPSFLHKTWQDKTSKGAKKESLHEKIRFFFSDLIARQHLCVDWGEAGRQWSLWVVAGSVFSLAFQSFC